LLPIGTILDCGVVAEGCKSETLIQELRGVFVPRHVLAAALDLKLGNERFWKFDLYLHIGSLVLPYSRCPIFCFLVYIPSGQVVISATHSNLVVVNDHQLPGEIP
jgi:hypothetical protein